MLPRAKIGCIFQNALRQNWLLFQWTPSITKTQHTTPTTPTIYSASCAKIGSVTTHLRVLAPPHLRGREQYQCDLRMTRGVACCMLTPGVVLSVRSYYRTLGSECRAIISAEDNIGKVIAAWGQAQWVSTFPLTKLGSTPIMWKRTAKRTDEHVIEEQDQCARLYSFALRPLLDRIDWPQWRHISIGHTSHQRIIVTPFDVTESLETTVLVIFFLTLLRELCCCIQCRQLSLYKLNKKPQT